VFLVLVEASHAASFLLAGGFVSCISGESASPLTRSHEKIGPGAIQALRMVKECAEAIPPPRAVRTANLATLMSPNDLAAKSVRRRIDRDE